MYTFHHGASLMVRAAWPLYAPLALLLGSAVTIGAASAQDADEWLLDAPVVIDADSAFAPASADVTYEFATGDAKPCCDCPACKEAAKKKKRTRTCKTCCHGTLLDWSLYPETIRPFPRPGMFPIPPTDGPAYFSVWDLLTGEERQAPPRSGYAPFTINQWPFFDADWRFVEGINPGERTLVERLKRIHLGDCLLLSTGGEVWMRYSNEYNSRLTTIHNDYLLPRVRVYGDAWYSDWLRLYGEFVWADSYFHDLPSVPPDIDRGDIQNLFVDVKLFELADKPVYVRGGRQELLYGSQRMITPLSWANKRHTFEGVKIFRQGEEWDFDAFWTQYVPPNASDFDSVDNNQDFAGAWLTHRPEAGETVDFYYLFYDNTNVAFQQGIQRLPFQGHTMGTRWAGKDEDWLWDFESALQFGEQANEDLFAGMGTAGVGHNWSCESFSPTAWIYYDFASGDSNPGAGGAHTFHPLFPFGHYYLGWMDLVGRQNIHDLNAHFYIYPEPWLTVWLQYHRFWLDERRDALYNAGGVAIRRDPTGAAGRDVGDEIDIVLNFHLTRYSDVLVSWNKLYGGGFLEATPGPADAEALYLMFQQRW
jgi:hypothetical protein